MSGIWLDVKSIFKGDGTGTFNWTGGHLKVEDIAFDLTVDGNELTFKNSGSVSGNLSLVNDAIINLEIRSITDFDKVTINGALNASGGDLHITLGDSYIPPVGSSFKFFEWDSLTADFDMIHMPDLPDTSAWSTVNFATQGIATVYQVPDLDWDDDGVDNHLDAYPSDNARSTMNVDLLSPSKFAEFDSTTTTFEVVVSPQIAASFNGNVAVVVNAGFTDSNIDVFGESQAINIPNTFNITVSANNFYVVHVGFDAAESSYLGNYLSETIYAVVLDAPRDTDAYRAEYATVVTVNSALNHPNKTFEIGRYSLGEFNVVSGVNVNSNHVVMGSLINSSGPPVSITENGIPFHSPRP